MAAEARDINSVDRIGDRIARRILDPTLASESRFLAGERLPSVRDMADQLGCATGTVHRAYAVLVGRRLVLNRGVFGYVVAPNVEEIRLEPATRELLTTVDRLVDGGYTSDDVAAALRIVLGDLDGHP